MSGGRRSTVDCGCSVTHEATTDELAFAVHAHSVGQAMLYAETFDIKRTTAAINVHKFMFSVYG